MRPESLRQLQRESGLRGQRRGKGHGIDQRIALLRAVHGGHQGLAAALQAYALGLLARHGRVECQAQRAYRQTVGLGVLALAGEFGREGLAHLVGKALFHRIGHAAGRGHAAPVDQLHLAAGREPAPAGQRRVAERLLGCRLVQMQRAQQLGALRALDQAHRHTLAHAIGQAPHMLLQASDAGRAIELQHKELLLVDRLMGAGPYALHKRATTIKLIAFSA